MLASCCLLELMRGTINWVVSSVLEMVNSGILRFIDCLPAFFLNVTLHALIKFLRTAKRIERTTDLLHVYLCLWGAL